MVVQIEDMHLSQRESGEKRTRPIYISDSSYDYLCLGLLNPAEHNLADQYLFVGDLVLVTDVQFIPVYENEFAARTSKTTTMHIFSNPVLPTETCKSCFVCLRHRTSAYQT